MRRLLTISAVLAPLFAASGLAGAPAPQEGQRRAIWEWSGVSRVVAVGDLHGSFDKLVRLARSAGLIDQDLAWVGGTDHLVVAGDFLDRGSGEREIMDLLRRLQEEAAAAGGRVHVLLGNHEAMNLMRDSRYVNAAGCLAFARDETPAERRAAWRAYSVARVGEAGLGELRREFQRRYPEGYFARQRLLAGDGEYGAWLLGLPSVVKIDRVLYVHGGLTGEFAALGVDGLNRRVLEALRRHLELRHELERAGEIALSHTLPEILQAVSKIAEKPRHPQAATAAALRESASDPVLGARGPLWYRGSALEDERIERRVLDEVLALLDADAMVIAHTYTGGNRITSRFHGKLYRVDHGILDSSRPLALVVERDQMLVLDPAAGAWLAPQRELPTGQSLLAADADLSDEERADLLRAGTVTHAVELGRGSSRPRLLVLERDGDRARGLFKTVAAALEGGAADRYQHEIAAFALDRSLGLGLVPLTVERSIDGRPGSLQSWVEGAVDRAAARAYQLDLYESETTRHQLARAELFDALIGNVDRRPDDLLLRVDGERLYLVDHSRAFSTSTEMSWDGSSVELVEPELAGRLRALDRATLVRDLGSLLAPEQIDALLARRDLILDRLAAREGAASAQTAVVAD